MVSSSLTGWFVYYLLLLGAVSLSNTQVSTAMGAWQGLVHIAGPSARCLEDSQEYFVCGAREEVARSVFTPFAGQQ